MSAKTKDVFYAVAKGRSKGVFTKWTDVVPLVKGYTFAKFRKFATREEAEAFVAEHATIKIRSSGQQQILTTVDGLALKPPSAPIDIPEDTYTPIKETKDILIVFTDGACSANGRANARASYSSVWPWHPEHDGGWRITEGAATNNRGEFMGLVKSFEIADKIDPECTKELLVFTDSMFLINCLTKWVVGWKRNGFKKADGSPVLNQDLLVLLDQLMRRRKVTLRHVSAHTGKKDWASQFNDKADRLAKNALGAS